MTTLLPMDSNIADNIWVLDIVYDGLFRYDPETTEPYPYVAESIETTDNKVWTITIKPARRSRTASPSTPTHSPGPGTTPPTGPTQ